LKSTYDKIKRINMNKQRMLVEHKISFFPCFFDSIKGSLSTTTKSCCEVGNEKTKKKTKKKKKEN
jgi:hypothetical protein